MMYHRQYHLNDNITDQILIPHEEGYQIIPAKNLRDHEKSVGRIRPNNTVLNSRWVLYQIKNISQFLIMISGMVLILGYLGYNIAGLAGLVAVMMSSLFSLVVSSNISIDKILFFMKARYVHPVESPFLYSMTDKLAQQAGLNKKPNLYLSHSPEMNAFTVEDKNASAVVVSSALLKNLNRNELYGVLAHEIAHLKNNDIKLMLVANQINRITGYMAFLGQILLFLNLPLLFLSQAILPWSFIILLIVSPMISSLFQVAILRNREFRADLDAVALSGDAYGLASALNKINYQTGFLKRIYAHMLPQIPEFLRTHPNTRVRIERLNDIQAGQIDRLRPE